MHYLRLIALSLTVPIASCASSHTAASAPVEHGAAATAPSPTTTYYEGKVSVTLPDGKVVGEYPSHVKRTIDAGAHTIIEDVVSEDPRHPGEFVVTFAVDAAGKTFTMTEEKHAFTGTGTLDGPAWAWTAWHSTSTVPIGPDKTVTVTSDDELTADGMKATKHMGEGAPVIVELYKTAADASAFDAARAKVAAH